MPKLAAAPSGAGCLIALPILLVALLLGVAVAQEPDTKAAEKATVQQGNLMKEEKEQKYRTLLPDVKDKQIQAILKDPNTFYYTEEEIPKAYQEFEGALQSVHDPANNISAVKPKEPHGNGNVEFPWGRPFGTHTAPSSKSYRFINLPVGEDGKRLPIVWWRQNPYFWKNVAKQATSGYAWTFPAGATVGEILYMEDSKGYSHVYEIRVRRRAIDRWTVNVYRPFPTAQDLVNAVKSGWTEYDKDKDLSALISHLEKPLDGKIHTLRDNHPTSEVFNESRQIDELPAIPEEYATRLLDQTTFKSALGMDWKEGKNAPHAPTTKAGFHIVPKDYSGGFIAADSKSCMKCHNTCNQHVREFEADRDWYGRVRGSDGIFSFHPFDPSCISKDGNPLAPAINQDMVKKGILAEYNPRIHSKDIYKRIAIIKEEALTPPE